MVAELGAGGCSLPKAGAWVPLPGVPTPLAHSSGSGSDTLSSFLWGLPPASKTLPSRRETSGGAVGVRGSKGDCHPGISGRDSGSLLSPPWSSEGEWVV